jgi:hypothetical protein
VDRREAGGVAEPGFRRTQRRESRQVWIPDVPLDEIDAARASALYLAVTKSEGKFGPLKAATHHGYLKTVKEFWRWLLDGGHIERDAFAKVKPIGKANAGSSSSGRSRRRRWNDSFSRKRSKVRKARWRFWCSSISGYVHRKFSG